MFWGKTVPIIEYRAINTNRTMANFKLVTNLITFFILIQSPYDRKKGKVSLPLILLYPNGGGNFGINSLLASLSVSLKSSSVNQILVLS